MFKILCYCLCICVVLVKSQNQYQLLSTCPYTAQRYGNIYGSQPLVTQPSPYTQQYIVQNPSANYQTSTTPIANQLQESYFNRLFTNPAIQAFIDPSTKIYNQNGIDISDQIRPKGTPNVVNNYFIVPTDYVKNNESIQKDIRRNKNKVSNVGSVTKIPPNKVIQRPLSYKNKDANLQTPKHKDLKPKEDKRRVSNVRSNKNKKSFQKQEYNQSAPRKSDKTLNNLKDKEIFLNDEDVIQKQRNNIKRQDGRTKTQVEANVNIAKEEVKNQDEQTSVCKTSKSIQNAKKEKPVNADVQSQKPPVKKGKVENTKSNINLPQNTHDICEDCVELDNRSIRNSVDNVHNSESSKKSSRTQENFMKQWMSYIKSFAPNQNFEAFDFSTANLPYNFEQMFQIPQFTQPSVDNNSHNQTTKKRKRKQKRKNKKPEDAKTNCNDDTKVKTIELVPKFIEFESVGPITEHIKGEEFAKPNLELSTHSLEATYYSPDESTEDTLPIMYDIIDYYPDFTKDKIYASNEDDLFLFNNRHFYNMDDEKELNRERRKYETTHADNTIKHPENRIRVNDIYSSNKDNKKAHLKHVFEDIKFQTPPALTEPGFETRRVNIRDNSGNFHTHCIGESEKPAQKHVDNKRNDVETVFARSKVVKYGQQGGTEAKVKAISEDDFNHDRGHKQARDSDATIVFAQSWT